MVARHFTELECWQLANGLKLRVYEVVARPKLAGDFRFCDQIRESARSAPRNISEGFGKYDPPEFARYLQIAKGSLTETQNHLRDGFDRSYLSRGELEELDQLARRARSAVIALIRYLESCPRKWRRAPRPSEASVDHGPSGTTLRTRPLESSAERDLSKAASEASPSELTDETDKQRQV